MDPRVSRKIVELPLKFITEAAVDTVALPNGDAGKWESIHGSESPGVCVAGITTEGKMIFVKIYRFPVSSRCIELPGGNKKGAENLAAAACRELLEETGYSAPELTELTRIWVYNGKTNHALVIYFAKDCRKIAEPKLEEMEKASGLEVILMSSADAMKRIASGDMAFDPPISVALVALIGRGLL